MTSDAENPKIHDPATFAMARFTSMGECMVELAPGAQPDDLKLGFAGDTFNTAWYVRSLAQNCKSRFVSRIGTDAVSDRMLAMMRQAGVETDHILRSKDRSVGLYLISLQDGERSFSYWRDSSAARLLACDPGVLAAAMKNSDVIYFTGITLAILDDAGRQNLLDAVRTARAAGQTIVFDSNLRPRLWACASTMQEIVMQAASVSDVVLPSYDDEVVHFGDTTPDATLDRYRGAGATTVVVKNGVGKITYLRNGATGTVRPQPVAKVVDTTSAGDSFNAGFLVGLQQGKPTEDAIRFASKVAGHVIGHKGALVPFPAGGLL